MKPKVSTRWENGTPKIKKETGKFVTSTNVKLQRRMSDTFVIQHQFSPPRTRIEIDMIHEHDDDDNVFDNSVEDEENVDDASLRAMASSKMKIESAMRKFSRIFKKIEDHMKNKAKTETERAFIRKQVKLLMDGAKQVDYMMSDLTERTIRMEKFLENRNAGLDWNLWEN